MGVNPYGQPMMQQPMMQQPMMQYAPPQQPIQQNVVVSQPAAQVNSPPLLPSFSLFLHIPSIFPSIIRFHFGLLASEAKEG